MTPTYYPLERYTLTRAAYWACRGHLHKHKSRGAAEKCEDKYPTNVPVGRRGTAKRPEARQ